MKNTGKILQAGFIFILLWIALAVNLNAASKNPNEINPQKETGYFRDLGTNDGIESRGSDDFEWYMPIHLGPSAAWEKPAAEGETTYRSTKIETNGTVAYIYCKAFLFDTNKRSGKTILVEIHYKDILPAAAVISGYCRDDQTNGWGEIGRVEGKNDGVWKTAKLEIAPEKLLADKDENYCLRIDTTGTGGSFVVDWVRVYTNVPSSTTEVGEGEAEVMGFETEGFWGFAHYPARKDYEVYFDSKVKHNGARSLAISNVCKESTVSWGGCFNKERITVNEKTAYRVTFYAKAENSSGSSLTIYFGGQPRKQMEVFGLPDGAYDWQKMEFVFITPVQTDNLRLYFKKGGQGGTWVDDVRVEKLAEGEYQTITKNNKTYIILSRAEQPDPALPVDVKGAFEKTGYIIYARQNPRAFYPASIPQAGEITNAVKTFACPGQYAAAWFMMHGLKDVKSVKVGMASDLVCSTGGNPIKRNDISIKHIKFWLRKSYCMGLSARMIPEMLENNKSVDIAAGKNEGFWLQVKIPEDAQPGQYSSKISVNCGDAPATALDFAIDVLPFKLEKPADINWITWSDLSERYRDSRRARGEKGYHVYTEKELLRYLQDMKDYGITAIFDHTYNDFESTARTARLFKTTGFKGPLALLHWPDGYAMGKRGKEWKYGTMYPEMEDPKFQQDTIDYLKALDVVVRNAGVEDWYLHAYGELNYDTGGWFERAVWVSKMANRAGVKLWLTLYPLAPLKGICPYLSGAVDVMGFYSGSAKIRETYYELAKKYNFKIYGLGGTYTGDEGGLMPDRLSAGFQLYKSGALGCAIWTWQRPGGGPRKGSWDELDGLEIETCMAYPPAEISENEVNISTLQLEGVREGIDDYCYIYTLEQWLKRAQEKGLGKDADDARKKLDGIIASVPWGMEYSAGNSYSQPGNFDNAKAGECRRQIADEIIKLKKAVQN